MVDFLGLALIVTAVVVAVVVATLAGSLLFPGSGRTRCTRCGASIPASGQACTVCEAPFEPGEASREEANQGPSTVRVPTAEEDPEEGVVNPGVPRGLVKVAAIVMFVGIGTRVLGMLDPAGLEIGIPDAVTAGLTVVGGLAMFVGFVVLDIA